MPISFHCETCRRSICVPDGSEGKKTRCPECYSIVQIPFHGNTTLLTVPKQPEFAPSEVDDDPLGISGKKESRWDPQEPTSSNPFADQPAPPPIERPSTPRPGHPRDTTKKQKTLKNLAAILLALGVPMLVFSLLAVSSRVLALIDNPTDDSQTLGALGGMATLLLVQVVTLIALNEARVMRNYATARTGMILAIIPLSYPAALMVVPLGLAIWGVALLYDPDVRAAFDSEQGNTPD
ncbi:hypothetical protein Pan97_03790 [Bremerella volcania]|uniref:Uncharacterized protein n=1 Tax=Bremerella volcania TaxID=2527984 RepID=A0A518C2G3_9BACT|nr:hypothetical protein [Bremerella volcania]QDU73408.1 hypothetical protein Pan97_03790 [Bremerella volcania]